MQKDFVSPLMMISRTSQSLKAANVKSRRITAITDRYLPSSGGRSSLIELKTNRGTSNQSKLYQKLFTNKRPRQSVHTTRIIGNNNPYEHGENHPLISNNE